MRGSMLRVVLLAAAELATYMARGALAPAHGGPLRSGAELGLLVGSGVQPWSLSKSPPKTLISLDLALQVQLHADRSPRHIGADEYFPVLVYAVLQANPPEHHTTHTAPWPACPCALTRPLHTCRGCSAG